MTFKYQPETLAVRAGQERSQFNEHAEALYLTSSYVFDSAAQVAARFSGEDHGKVRPLVVPCYAAARARPVCSELIK
jgi:O-acetylhomoserine/O-acetylserine sulfhydrylase-like pyridoxal-dependent enzyme